MSDDKPYGYWTYGRQNALQGGPTTFVEQPDGTYVRRKYPGNPAVMEDEFILWAVKNDPAARQGFFDLLPTMDAVSQSRLNGLVEAHPDAFYKPLMDSTQQNDNLQRKEARAGVRVRLPRPTRRW